MRCLSKAQLCLTARGAAVPALGKRDAPRAEGMLHVPRVAPKPLLLGDIFSPFLLYPDNVDKSHFLIIFFLVSGLLFHLPAYFQFCNVRSDLIKSA